MHGDGRLLPPRLPVPGLAKPQNNVPWSSLALRQPIVPKNRAAKKNSRSPLRKRRRRAIAPIGNARRAAQAEPPFFLSLYKVRMVKDVPLFNPPCQQSSARRSLAARHRRNRSRFSSRTVHSRAHFVHAARIGRQGDRGLGRRCLLNLVRSTDRAFFYFADAETTTSRLSIACVTRTWLFTSLGTRRRLRVARCSCNFHNLYFVPLARTLTS